MASPVIKLEEHIGVGKLYNLLWSEIWDIWDIIFDSLSAAEMESSDIVIAALTKITREDIEAQLNAVSELPLGGADTPQQQIINYRFALSVGHRAMIMFRPPVRIFLVPQLPSSQLWRYAASLYTKTLLVRSFG